MPEDRSTAKAVSIEFDVKKEFTVKLHGQQIKLLLEMIKSMHFKGSDAFLVGDTITALQMPLLDDAHGAAEPSP